MCQPRRPARSGCPVNCVNGSADKLELARKHGMNLEKALLEVQLAASLERKAISNSAVLNEAFDYAKPSSFSRGIRLDLGNVTVLLISGTASIDEHGRSIHIGD